MVRELLSDWYRTYIINKIFKVHSNIQNAHNKQTVEYQMYIVNKLGKHTHTDAHFQHVDITHICKSIHKYTLAH